MKQRMLRLASLGVLAFSLTIEGFAQTPGQPLGVLFYSPSQREAIVMARRGQAVETSAASFRVDGVMRSSKGAGSVWVNGDLLAEGQRVGELQIETQGMTVRMSGGSQLKVGQSVSATGEVGKKDLLEEGSFSLGGVPSKRQAPDAKGLKLSSSSSGPARGRP
jgi:hypothetical protein